MAKLIQRQAPWQGNCRPIGMPGGAWATSLGRDLEAWGFTREQDAPVMAIDLHDLPTHVPCPPRLEIVRAETASLLQAWLGVLSKGFAAPPVRGTPPPCPQRCWRARAAASTRCYLGVLDGVPVATAMLVPSHGIAGIHYVSTVPQAQGGGIGTVLTWTVLRDAGALGYRTGGLVSTAAGVSVYRRLGFRTYGAFSFYDWIEEGPPWA